MREGKGEGLAELRDGHQVPHSEHRLQLSQRVRIADVVVVVAFDAAARASAVAVVVTQNVYYSGLKLRDWC